MKTITNQRKPMKAVFATMLAVMMGALGLLPAFAANGSGSDPIYPKSYTSIYEYSDNLNNPVIKSSYNSGNKTLTITGDRYPSMVAYTENDNIDLRNIALVFENSFLDEYFGSQEIAFAR